MNFNLARTYSKTADGLYPRLILRGEQIIRQGLDADYDEHQIWLDWRALITEAIINPNFDTRSQFLNTLTRIKQETKH
jgi:hypothetical protein